MSRREDLSRIPGAIEELFEKGLSGLPAALRRARLGEGPVFILGSSSELPAAWTAAYAFQDLLGRAAVVQSPSTFEHYAIHAVEPRSTVLVLPDCGETEEAVRAVKRAKDRGAVVWALTSQPEGPLMKLAHGVLTLERPDPDPASVLSVLLHHAYVASFAVKTARILRPPWERIQQYEEEFSGLSRKIEWLFAHLSDAAASFAAQLRERGKVFVAGAGPFHPMALQGALDLRRRLGLESVGLETGELHGSGHSMRGRTVLFLSSSHCRAKKQVQEAAAQARIAGAEVLSITDSNDRELVARSATSLLVPFLAELPGALLVLTLVEWISCFRAAIPAPVGSAPNRAGSKTP